MLHTVVATLYVNLHAPRRFPSVCPWLAILYRSFGQHMGLDRLSHNLVHLASRPDLAILSVHGKSSVGVTNAQNRHFH